jgi:hypothetical protein
VETILACGGDTGTLKLAQSGAAWLSADELLSWAAARNRIALMDRIWMWSERQNYELELAEDVLAVETSHMMRVRARGSAEDWPPAVPFQEVSDEAHRFLPSKNSIVGFVHQTVAKAWDLSVPDLVRAADQRPAP